MRLLIRTLPSVETHLVFGIVLSDRIFRLKGHPSGRRRRARPDSVSSRSRVHPDNGRLPGLQAEAPFRGERQHRHRTVIARDGLPVPWRPQRIYVVSVPTFRVADHSGTTRNSANLRRLVATPIRFSVRCDPAYTTVEARLMTLPAPKRSELYLSDRILPRRLEDLCGRSQDGLP
jgi:hypothetical protein